MPLTSLPTQAALASGPSPEHSSLSPRPSATSAATSVKPHGCLPIPGKDTSKAAKPVIGTSTPSISGRTIITATMRRRRRPMKTMGNIISDNCDRPARKESVSFDLQMIHSCCISQYLLKSMTPLKGSLFSGKQNYFLFWLG